MCIIRMQNEGTSRQQKRLLNGLDTHEEQQIRKYAGYLADIQRGITGRKEKPGDDGYLFHYARLCHLHILAAIHVDGESSSLTDYLIKLSRDITPDDLPDRIVDLARKKHSIWYHRNVCQ